MADPKDFKNFNALTYGGGLELKQKGSGQTHYPYTDGSDAYANNYQTVISFFHVPTQKEIFFKAFITAFNETYASDWSSERIYGRSDPVQMFKQNERKISLGFKIPAASSGEAYENLAKLQLLMRFLYPVYAMPTAASGALTVTQSPLIRIKFMNLLAKQAPGYTQHLISGDGLTREQYLKDYIKSSTFDAEQGLLGLITNLTFNHNMEGDIGVIDAPTIAEPAATDSKFKLFSNPADPAPTTQGSGVVLPKMIDVTLGFSAIHEHSLGWEPNPANDPPGSLAFSSQRFPYNVLLDPGTPPVDESVTGESGDTATEDGKKALFERTMDGLKKARWGDEPRPSFWPIEFTDGT